MSHFLAGFASALWLVPIVVGVRWIKSAFRAGISDIRPCDFTE